MGSSRQPQKGGNVIKGISRVTAITTTLTPGSIFKDGTTGFYYFVGDAGVLLPLTGSLNVITSVASDGVLMRRTGGAALITDVGGAAPQARIRCTLYKATTNAVVQGAIMVSTGGGVSGVTVATGTGIVPPFAGNENTIFRVVSNGSGVVDCTVTYNATGAKPIVVEYGPDQLFNSFTVS